MHSGKLTAIVGCMFASKTDSLIFYLNQERYRKREVLCFKPTKDNRYSTDSIVSHNGSSLECIPVESAAAIVTYVQPWLNKKTSLGIDEAQFFDPAIASVLSTLAMDGFRIFAAGLDLDSFGHPFGPMPDILAYADEIIKLHAQCVRCGEDANRTFRKQTSTEIVLIGGESDYEPMCKSCWRKN